MKKIPALILICILLGTLNCVRAEEKDVPAAEEETAVQTLADRAAAVLPDYEDLLPWFEEDLYDIMGIEEDDYSDFIFLTDESGMEGREIVMFLCVSPEAVNRIQDALTSYLARRVKETQNYLPDAWELLNRAVLITRDTTVLLVSGPDAAAEAEMLLTAE